MGTLDIHGKKPIRATGIDLAPLRDRRRLLRDVKHILGRREFAGRLLDFSSASAAGEQMPVDLPGSREPAAVILFTQSPLFEKLRCAKAQRFTSQNLHRMRLLFVPSIYFEA